MNTKKYEELLVLLRSHKTDKEILEVLSDYHENDIADMLAGMNEKERKRLYRLLGTQRTAEIFAYLDEPQAYFDELSVEQAARVVSLMDSDDAVDLLENLEDEDKKEIVEHLDEEAEKDVRMLLSYDDDEIGSYMTTNYICIPSGLTVKQAMSQLVRQAGENDNIMTIYVVDSDECFAGAIDLKDLITAREGMNLESIIAHSYPYVLDHEKIDDCIDTIKDYAEDSIPVLSKDKHILGVITSDDIVEMVDNEMGEDYAKLAGLTAEEDLKETTLQSMKKRMPWLIILLFLGMIVSSVVGIFENVVAALPIVICFQSLVLDMAGNVGTQSLAVTIRVLMDENLSGKQKLLLVVKEVRIGLVNGGLLGIMALVFLGIYVHLFKGYTWFGAFAVSGCVGVSLLVAMAISSLVGTVIPMFFHKIKIDPAVASGPLITTVNDLVAVVPGQTLRPVAAPTSGCAPWAGSLWQWWMCWSAWTSSCTTSIAASWPCSNRLWRTCTSSRTSRPGCSGRSSTTRRPRATIWRPVAPPCLPTRYSRACVWAICPNAWLHGRRKLSTAPATGICPRTRTAACSWTASALWRVWAARITVTVLWPTTSASRWSAMMPRA